MKRFTTTTELIEAYTADHNSRCHPDKHFTPAEIKRHFLTTMTRQALLLKHGISISDKQTSVIHGFGYVEVPAPAFEKAIDAPTGFRKEIVYDRESRDYAMYLNGELVGYARSYSEAEIALDNLVFEILSRTPAPAKPPEVPVSPDCTALVDEDDYARVMEHSWYLNGRGYAITSLYSPKRTISLHRFVIQAKQGEEVDHQNGNKLDCRKSNLRVASRGQNIHNRGKRRDGQASQYKGVRKHRQCERWEANIGINGRRKYLGLYKTEEQAAKAYDAAARQAYGEFAHLNFPDQA